MRLFTKQTDSHLEGLLTPVSKRIEFNLQLMSNKKIYVT